MRCPFLKWHEWPESYTPVQYAAENGHPEMVELLLAKGAVPGTLECMTALEHAITNGDTDTGCIYLLVKHGLSTRVESPVEGKAYLVKAACEGRQRMMQSLVENGVKLDASNVDDQNAMRYAVENGSVKCLTYLLEDDAIAEAETLLHTTIMTMLDSHFKKGSDRDTALQFAAHIADKEIVQLLLDKGANASASDKDGITLLHYVAGASFPYFNKR